MAVLSSTVRILVAFLAVCVVVAVMLITGWADDRAKPGSGGRVPVPSATTDPR